MFLQLYEVSPGPSSQTTSVIEEIIIPESLNLKFFDVNAPQIEMAGRDTWDDSANQILQAHNELWDRLAEL